MHTMYRGVIKVGQLVQLHPSILRRMFFVFSEQGSYANCQLPGHCCNSGIFWATTPRCFPYTTACQLTQPVLGYTAQDTALALGPPSCTLGSWFHYCWTQALLDALGSLSSRWEFSTPRPWPHMFYSKGVTNQLVQTLSPRSLDYKARHRPLTFEKDVMIFI